jgi:dTDP-glucose 4,6-dehydratase
MIIVTGGAGFIGSNFIIDWFSSPQNEPLLNLDALTYAGNLTNSESIRHLPDYEFQKGSIGDKELVTQMLQQYQPRAIINFAAESHVDR